MLNKFSLTKAGLKARMCTVSATGLLLLAMGSGDAARAAFVATICDDAACSGGNDIIVTDNGIGDNAAPLGVIAAAGVNAFGFSFILNLAQSKPLIGSPASPHLDLNFT